MDGDLWDRPKVAAWMSEMLERPIHPQRGWEYLRALEMRRLVNIGDMRKQTRMSNNSGKKAQSVEQISGR